MIVWLRVLNGVFLFWLRMLFSALRHWPSSFWSHCPWLASAPLAPLWHPTFTFRILVSSLLPRATVSSKSSQLLAEVTWAIRGTAISLPWESPPACRLRPSTSSGQARSIQRESQQQTKSCSSRPAPWSRTRHWAFEASAKSPSPARACHLWPSRFFSASQASATGAAARRQRSLHASSSLASWCQLRTCRWDLRTLSCARWWGSGRVLHSLLRLRFSPWHLRGTRQSIWLSLPKASTLDWPSAQPLEPGAVWPSPRTTSLGGSNPSWATRCGRGDLALAWPASLSAPEFLLSSPCSPWTRSCCKTLQEGCLAPKIPLSVTLEVQIHISAFEIRLTS